MTGRRDHNVSIPHLLCPGLSVDGLCPLGESPVTGTRGRWRRGTEGDGDLTGNLYLFKNNVGTIRKNCHSGTLACGKCRGEKSSTSLVYHFFTSEVAARGELVSGY